MINAISRGRGTFSICVYQRSTSSVKTSISFKRLLATGLIVPGLAGQSKEFPTYVTGPQRNGSWVVSSGQVITPAGTQVDLGIRVRAKAIALNPNAHTHTAAVPQASGRSGRASPRTRIRKRSRR